MTDDTHTCDNHIDQLISTLNSARYAVKAEKGIVKERFTNAIFLLHLCIRLYAKV